MRRLALVSLLAGAAITGCATTPPAVVTADGRVCAAGSIDADGNGAVTAAEWNAWRASGFADWDLDNDNRISAQEFESCYRGGGFYPVANYNADYWNPYWTAFDANGDGFLTSDEYWSAQAWGRVDRNNNGIIDSNEWVWWPG